MQTEHPNENEIFDDMTRMQTYMPIGRTALYAAIKNDGFPQPYRFGKRISLWKRSEVLAWLSAQPRGVRPPTSPNGCKGNK